jgi:xanthine dehydrogenase YagS FAD-binding subunit
VNGRIVERARVALGGVAPVPWRAAAAEEMLLGQELTQELCETTSRAATEGARPLEQNAYKVTMVQGLLKQALQMVRKSL